MKSIYIIIFESFQGLWVCDGDGIAIVPSTLSRQVSEGGYFFAIDS